MSNDQKYKNRLIKQIQDQNTALKVLADQANKIRSDRAVYESALRICRHEPKKL